MSILNKLNNLNKTVVTAARTEMTPVQMEQCKAALRRDNRGYNVQPNKWDVHTPYRVSINYSNEWHNFGNFKSADVAAAVGSIVSLAFFGEKAQAGSYDVAKVEGNEEFVAWIADGRNAEVMARANGEQPCVHGGQPLAKQATSNAAEEPNPF